MLWSERWPPVINSAASAEDAEHTAGDAERVEAEGEAEGEGAGEGEQEEGVADGLSQPLL